MVLSLQNTSELPNRRSASGHALPERRGTIEDPLEQTRGLNQKSGGDLLSRAVTRQVPSAQEGLTTVFGMGTGVTPPPLPPENVFCCRPHVPFDNRISDEDLWDQDA